MRVLDLDNDGIITTDELQTAMSFLREQLGEEELRHMLETLRAEGEDITGGRAQGIDVNKLMHMAGVLDLDESPPSSPRASPPPAGQPSS